MAAAFLESCLYKRFSTLVLSLEVFAFITCQAANTELRSWKQRRQVSAPSRLTETVCLGMVLELGSWATLSRLFAARFVQLRQFLAPSVTSQLSHVLRKLGPNSGARKIQLVLRELRIMILDRTWSAGPGLNCDRDFDFGDGIRWHKTSFSHGLSGLQCHCHTVTSETLKASVRLGSVKSRSDTRHTTSSYF